MFAVPRRRARPAADPAPPEGASSALAPPAPAAAAEVLKLLWDSPFPASLQDDSFRFIDVNPAFCAFVGRPREAVVGLDFIDLLPEEDRLATIENRKRFVVSGGKVETAYVAEGRLLDAGGLRALVSRRRAMYCRPRAAGRACSPCCRTRPPSTSRANAPTARCASSTTGST